MPERPPAQGTPAGSRFGIALGIFVSAFLGFALPMELLVRNRDFFDAATPHVVALAAATTLVLALGISAALAASPPALRRGLAVLLASVAGVAFLHNLLPLGTSSLLDGSALEFDFTPAFLVLSLGITLLVPALVLVRHRLVLPPASQIALWMTPVVLGHALWGLSRVEWDEPGPEPPRFEEVARFSADRNVLMILMDSLQSDVLSEVITADSALEERFRGFVLYADAVGAAATTYMTMPAMLAGRGYDGRSPLRRFFTDQIRERTFLTDLADAGWRVTHVDPMIECEQRIEICTRSSVMLASKWQVAVREYVRLLDLGLLNASPYLLRSTLHGDGAWLLSRWFEPDDRPYLRRSVAFLERFAGAVNVAETPPSLKLIHLMNTHPPFALDRDCERTRARRDPEAYRAQVRCGLELFLDVLDALRAEDVEDRTDVFLIADTGVTVGWRQAHLRAVEAGVDLEMAELIGNASPALMVRPAGRRERFAVSTAPVAIADVPQAVCDLAGSCRRRYGDSLFEIAPGMPRTRRFVDYEWSTGSWEKERLPRVDVWTVDGPAYLAESWSRVERILGTDGAGDLPAVSSD